MSETSKSKGNIGDLEESVPYDKEYRICFDLDENLHNFVEYLELHFNLDKDEYFKNIIISELKSRLRDMNF